MACSCGEGSYIALFAVSEVVFTEAFFLALACCWLESFCGAVGFADLFVVRIALGLVGFSFGQRESTVKVCSCDDQFVDNADWSGDWACES